VHPREYGTFTRVLGRYVRDEGVLGLEEAVRKMTGAVARRLRIADRGMIAPGCFADLVVFDPDRVRDVATYDDPHRLSEGVLEVWVNGVLTVHAGTHTGATAGRFLRGRRWLGFRGGAGRRLCLRRRDDGRADDERGNEHRI
jgi:N-acyl-D-aspartate/D-glutamate deacylase